MGEFYTYLYIREHDGTFPAGTPYYVGKGKGERAFYTLTHRVKPPKNKSNILMVPVTCEDEALEYEMQIIEMFGRIDQGTGCLRNLTDGGEGRSGACPSDEARIKMSEAGKRRYSNPIERIKQSERVSRGKTGKPSPKRSPEWLKNHADALRKRWAEPEFKSRNTELRKGNKSRTGQTRSAEERRKTSESLRRTWALRKAV